MNDVRLMLTLFCLDLLIVVLFLTVKCPSAGPDQIDPPNTGELLRNTTQPGQRFLYVKLLLRNKSRALQNGKRLDDPRWLAAV